MKKFLTGLIGLGLVVFVVLLTFALWPSKTRVLPAATATVDGALIAKGQYLADAGDCTACHTAKGGKPFAGGLPIASPIGTLYSSNITPDPKTGIGGYSLDDFDRALRHGIAANGKSLYPAMPYPAYARISDDDLRALYAYFMHGVQPVNEVNRLNDVPWPLSMRWPLAIWRKTLAPTPESVAFKADRYSTAEVARGAYLVQGLGHCGSCHTPRNIAGGENRGNSYAGGVAEGWVAPALNKDNPAARAWTVDQLFSYLRTGIDMNHSVAAGPMGPVVHNLAKAPADDVHAIAVYVASLMGNASTKTPDAPAPDRVALAATSHPAGAALFAGACAGCHGPGAPMTAQGRPKLSLATPVRADTPRDAIQVVLQGIRPERGKAGPYMPALGGAFTDAQVADLVGYVRARYSDLPEWKDLEQAVARARREGTQ